MNMLVYVLWLFFQEIQVYIQRETDGDRQNQRVKKEKDKNVELFT